MHSSPSSRAATSAPGTIRNLEKIVQEKDETLREYVNRFQQTRITVPHITDESVVRAFHEGLRRQHLKEDITLKPYNMSAEIFFNIDRYMVAD